MSAVQVNRHSYQGVATQDLTVSMQATIPSVATNAGTSVSVTIPGVAVGDFVDVIPQFATGLQITAEVSAANTVKIYARNDSGSTINLGAQTFWFWISRLNPGLFT